MFASQAGKPNELTDDHDAVAADAVIAKIYLSDLRRGVVGLYCYPTSIKEIDFLMHLRGGSTLH